MEDEAFVISFVNGQIKTRVSLANIGDTVKAGVMLASACRVFSYALVDENNLPSSMAEQIQATVAEVFNEDLRKGDLGEEQSLGKEA